MPNSGLVVADLMTRIEAINATISVDSKSLTTYRYFPRRGEMPYVYALPGEATYEARDDSGYREGERQVRMLLVVDSPNAGVLSETAQRLAELAIDAMHDAYEALPQLQLSGVALDGVMGHARITRDSGLLFNDRQGFYYVEFFLSVPFWSKS